MKDYTNTIFLKDSIKMRLSAIIYTNESTETIQREVATAQREFLETDDEYFEFYCEYDYICYKLLEKYDLEIVNCFDNNNYILY